MQIAAANARVASYVEQVRLGAAAQGDEGERQGGTAVAAGSRVDSATGPGWKERYVKDMMDAQQGSSAAQAPRDPSHTQKDINKRHHITGSYACSGCGDSLRSDYWTGPTGEPLTGSPGCMPAAVVTRPAARRRRVTGACAHALGRRPFLLPVV